jgi:translation elongation factor EF-Ts
MDKKIAKRKLIDEIGEVDGVTSIYKRKLSEYEIDNETAIPTLLNSLLKAVEKNESFTASEGIFRKACDHKKLTMLENELQKCGLP